MKTSFLSAIIIGLCAVTPTLAARWGSEAESKPLHHRAPARRHHHKDSARKHHHKDPAFKDPIPQDLSHNNTTPAYVDPSHNDTTPAPEHPDPKNQKICHVPDIGTDSDSGPNIRKAFDDCKNDSKIILDSHYVLATPVLTSKLSNVEIVLTGTIDYSDDLDNWGDQKATTLFSLQGDNIHFHGTPDALRADGSAFNGRGQVWWDAFAEHKTEGNRPILLTITDSSNVVVDHIAFLQGPYKNIVVEGSTYIAMDSIIISAVSTGSPPANTDGIDIGRSSHVKLSNWDVKSGDDCVSLKADTTDVEIVNMNCKETHGIAIGSLGQFEGRSDFVQNVWIHNSKMSNGKAGVRIKFWPGKAKSGSDSGGGSGYVKNITFQNIQNDNVDMPILLDSCYLSEASYCAANPSKVKVSEVHYIDVTGTSSGKEKNVLVTLDCAQTCTDITAEGTRLTLPSSVQGPPVYSCKNVASKDKLDFDCT